MTRLEQLHHSHLPCVSVGARLAACPPDVIQPPPRLCASWRTVMAVSCRVTSRITSLDDGQQRSLDTIMAVTDHELLLVLFCVPCRRRGVVSGGTSSRVLGPSPAFKFAVLKICLRVCLSALVPSSLTSVLPSLSHSSIILYRLVSSSLSHTISPFTL